MIYKSVLDYINTLHFHVVYMPMFLLFNIVFYSTVKKYLPVF